MTEDTAPCAASELRDQLIEALRTAPATGHTYTPGHERFEHHPRSGERGHNYNGTCALCRDDLDALADAAVAVVHRWATTVVVERETVRAERAEAAIERVRERLDWLIANGFGAVHETLLEMRATLGQPPAEKETKDPSPRPGGRAKSPEWAEAMIERWAPDTDA